MVITKSFSWDTSAKTTSWICSSCLKICRENFVGILHPWITTIISSECSFLLTSNNFWSQTKYSEAALILLSHYVSTNSFFWAHFPLFFFRFLLLINSMYLPFGVFHSCTVLNLPCQRWSCFQIFVFYTFLHALGAGYRRKAKALGNIVYTNTTNMGSRFLWIFLNLKTLISSNTIFKITLNFLIYLQLHLHGERG